MTEPAADVSTNTVNTVSSKSVPEAYWAARKSAAFTDLSSRGRIVLKGADRASYLQGLLTNDIEALKPGEGCYALLLTPQGRIMADMNVFNLGDRLYRNHSSFIKDLAPEIGRGVRFTYMVRFF